VRRRRSAQFKRVRRHRRQRRSVRRRGDEQRRRWHGHGLGLRGGHGRERRLSETFGAASVILF
jgi:hypothetical protein